MQVHHYWTNQNKWNADDRFVNVPLKEEEVIVYVGGNNDGSDGFTLMQQCPTWSLLGNYFFSSPKFFYSVPFTSLNQSLFSMQL